MPIENYAIFKLLQNKDNFLIANNLWDSKNLSELSHTTKLQETKIIKILEILENAEIVKKHGTTFLLGGMGIKILEKILGMEFLAFHSKYFLKHSIDEIPHFLIQRTEAFTKCEVVETVWPVSKKMVDLAKESEGFINCIFSEPPFELAETLYEKVHSGIKLRLLFGRNSILPDCNDLVERLELNKPKAESKFEKRLCDSVITNLVASDKGACLMLGDENFELDMTNSIAGNDSNFIKWCNDFFEFKWRQGQSFARLRTDN